jgi:TRAP-type transport system periplasmic protein
MMKLNKREFLKTVGAGSAMLAMPVIARAAPITLKLSHYLPPQHQINGVFTKWADDLRAKSNGELDIQVFPAGQMGPPPRQYDLVRTGVADFAFIFTAFYPGRFPLTDLLTLPFILVGPDAKPVPGAKASVLSTKLKPEFASEYVDSEMLFSVTVTATGFFMHSVQVKTPDDVKGLRIRPTSGSVAEQLKAMGASPATIPPTELADAIAKGVVDGAIFNFEGGRAFQLQQAVKNVSTLAMSAGTFSFVANEAMMKKLPEKYANLIRDTTGVDAAAHVGGLYDSAEAAGREFMIGQGVEVVDLYDSAADPFRDVLKPVYDAQLEATRKAQPTTDDVMKKIEQLKADL